MLRDFQTELKNGVYTAWREGARVVMVVSPTGSGKTVVLGEILREYGVPACAIAHRQELVGQIALALNREQVPHGIIAPSAIVRQIVALEVETHGVSYFNHRAAVRVAGVDTLINHDEKDSWLQAVQLVVIDEGHHVLRKNKWGRAFAMFPNARGLFPTAHAVRADGEGLGAEADGLVNRLVIGPNCRELIRRGFLTDYRLFAVGSDIDFSHVEVGATGDYNLVQLRKATHASNRIVGDVVANYMRFAEGKLGITFAVDIEAAGELAAAYRAAGVPAEIITGKTPLNVRGAFMQQFRQRRILQLVSVDCLGEGVDVPAIEVVSMARRTASFQLYAQQFGRSLRPMIGAGIFEGWNDYSDTERVAHIAASGKPKAIIIDHVNNWQIHGLPDTPREYTLLRRAKRAGKGPQLLRTCVSCFQVYEAYLDVCPHCRAARPEPAGGRGSPELVEGDLVELDATVLAALRGEVAKVDGPCHPPHNLDSRVRQAIVKRHAERASGQSSLRATMALWGGWQRHAGLSDREIQRKFFLTFGVDVLSAQALGTTDAGLLELNVRAVLAANNVVERSAA